MLTLSAEQVRTLAPDASAARAGEGLADRRRWSDVGRTATAAWGLCQGSGSSPYQAAVDLDGPAYKCSCPSRKIPCKHALGLLFLLADASVDEAQPPDWAADWLESRASRAAAAISRAEQPAEIDPAARARRIESRERKVAAGIDELDRWLTDLVRRGLDSARGEGYRFWDAMGARLVDAQAAGLGRSVRGLGSAANAGQAWPHVLLEGSARLHLLCRAYRHLDRLPEALRADVRSLVGWTTKEDDLDPADSVDDRWLVVGRRVDDTGQVITARTFLIGEASGRVALHLAFGVGMAPPTVLALPGQAIRATLTFYPSATPLRAAVRPVLVPDGEVTDIPGAVGIADLLRQHAELLAANPFAGGSVAVVGPVVPVIRGGMLLVREDSGTALPVAQSSVPTPLAARLLAVSAGQPVTVVGEWDGTFLLPLSILADARLVTLDAGSGATSFRDGDAAWSGLVSAALLGTERTGDATTLPEVASALLPPDEDREHSLLTTAGILAIRRRAGRRPETDAEPLPEPMTADAVPPLTGEAARLIGQVAVDGAELLPEVLRLVRASRRRLPAEYLPELMAVAAEDPDLRPTITELAGPRAMWLASQIPELAPGVVPDRADWDAAWEASRGAKLRGDLVTAIRTADPDAAREALARWLPETSGDERAAVVTALRAGLGADDERLLATALGDSRLDVRRAATGRLALIEGSDLGTRLEERARPLLALHGRLRPSLAVTLPEIDSELETAGFGGRPPAGMGERAWLLRQLIGHVRPSRWKAWLGADPRSLVARGARSDEARPVLEGWAEAAGRFADADWLAALVGEPKAVEAMRLDLRDTITRLTAEERARVVPALAPAVEPDALAWLAPLCPSPWPPTVADAVIRALHDLAADQVADPRLYHLVRAAAMGLPIERGEELTTLASHDGQIRPALAGAVDTIRHRARIHAAFARLPAI